MTEQSMRAGQIRAGHDDSRMRWGRLLRISMWLLLLACLTLTFVISQLDDGKVHMLLRARRHGHLVVLQVGHSAVSVDVVKDWPQDQPWTVVSGPAFWDGIPLIPTRILPGFARCRQFGPFLYLEHKVEVLQSSSGRNTFQKFEGAPGASHAARHIRRHTSPNSVSGGVVRAISCVSYRDNNRCEDWRAGISMATTLS